MSAETMSVKPAGTTFAPEEPGGDRWVLNFGPQHPATHTTLRLVLELDGERVVSCVPHIGYLHSGFEKLGEHLDYNQYVTITDRMNYISPMANNIAWHHACELLFGIEITPRCKAIRTIIAELSRIQDHLLCVGTAALDLGGFSAFLYGFYEREIIYDLFEEICGARFTTSYTRVGGLMQDMQDVWPGKVKNFLKRLPKAMGDMESLLTRNRIFIERTKGIGYISRDDAIDWGMSGPLARASGVRRDLRKDEPYLCYADDWDGKGTSGVSFKVPVSSEGDVLSRYLVRLEEMRQSNRIIKQCVRWLRDNPGPVMLDDHKIVPPTRIEMKDDMESLIHHFKLFTEGYSIPAGEAYAAIEHPKGEFGVYMISDGANKPYRVKIRAAGFAHLAAMSEMVVGHMLADVVAVIGTQDIVFGEVDR